MPDIALPARADGGASGRWWGVVDAAGVRVCICGGANGSGLAECERAAVERARGLAEHIAAALNAARAMEDLADELGRRVAGVDADGRLWTATAAEASAAIAERIRQALCGEGSG